MSKRALCDMTLQHTATRCNTLQHTITRSTEGLYVEARPATSIPFLLMCVRVRECACACASAYTYMCVFLCWCLYVVQDVCGVHACCNVLQCVAVCCSVLVSVCRARCVWGARVLQCAAVCCSVLQCVGVCMSCKMCVGCMCVAVCCSVLQCVAVCCSVYVVQDVCGVHACMCANNGAFALHMGQSWGNSTHQCNTHK